MGLASIYYCTQPEVFVLPVEVSCCSLLSWDKKIANRIDHYIATV